MSKYFKILLSLTTTLFILPLLVPVFAQGGGGGPAGIPLIEYIFARIVCVAVPLGYIALLVVLVIAGIKYLTSAGEAKAVAAAHQTVTWGLLGILFLALAWLILLLIQNFTGVEVTKFSLSSLSGVQGFSGQCLGPSPLAPEPPVNPNSHPQSQPTQTQPIPTRTVTPSIIPERCDLSEEDDSIPDGPVYYVNNSLGYPVHIALAEGNNIGELLYPGYSGPNNFPNELGSFYRGHPYLDPGFADIIAEGQPREINYIDDASDRIPRTPTREGNEKLNALMHSIFPRMTQIVYLKARTSLTISTLWQMDEGNRRVWYGSLMKFPKGVFPSGLADFTHYSFLTIKRYLETHPNGFGPDSDEILSTTDWNATYLLGIRSKCADYYTTPAVASPLVYLYPANPLSISVNVYSPIISTELAIDNNGSWNIFASPDGTLTTLDDNKHKFIPYEFLRSDFRRPVNGFVIEGSKLEEYLRSEFWPKLGLTDSEINDYWQDVKPRVKPSLYYFVSLIDRSEIDRVLPMEVNPKPDTIIRNMTYILPLPQAPSISIMPLEEEKLKAPARNGFTVLENGVFTDGF